MKTWFCKDSQKWVTEIPRAFWIGAYDYKTGEKLYSDDTIYLVSDWAKHIYGKPHINISTYGIFKHYNDCSLLEFGSNKIPKLNIRVYNKLTKYI